MKTTTDRYDGVTIDPASLPESIEAFETQIKELLRTTIGKKLFWVKIPIDKSECIPILTALGFTFHHCNEMDIMLVKKLINNPIIPTSKNYAVGVGAIIRANDKLLVVKDRFSSGYKLPGGHIDHNEDLTAALAREVFEETGINATFESIVNLGHFTKGQFGESIMYIVCTAKALSHEITIFDDSEIVDARWMDITEFLQSDDSNDYNKTVVQAALETKELKLIKRKMKMKVPGEVFY